MRYKHLIKILLIFLPTLLINNAIAADVTCTGLYPNGEKIHLFWDGKAGKLNVNGKLHDIVDTKELKGNNFLVWSENYINDLGEKLDQLLK